jgi:hypothetical protein
MSNGGRGGGEEKGVHEVHEMGRMNTKGKGEKGMSAEGYDHKETMEQLVHAMRTFTLMVAGLDLAAASETLSMAHSIGPIVDPTAYHRALHNGGLDQQRRIVNAAQRFMKEIGEVWPDAKEMMQLGRQG